MSVNIAPFNSEAEEAILGAFINNNENINKVGDYLLPEHFYVEINKKIYALIQKLISNGHPATYLTVKSCFRDESNMGQIEEYLVDITSKAQLLSDVISLGRIIYDSYIKRQLIQISQDVAVRASKSSINESGQECLEEAEQMLFNLASRGNTENRCISLSKAVFNTVEHIKILKHSGISVAGVSTGFIALDRITGGLQNSDLIILAARPSMGKTALAVNIGYNAAKSFSRDPKNDKSVVIFSLEMSTEQVVTRIISTLTNIASSELRKGSFLNGEEMSRVTSVTATVKDIPLFIDDTASPTISAIRTKARRMSRHYNLGLIVVDYLQLVRGSTEYSNRVNEIGEISQGLKAIAKELNIPVIALSQLSRAVESRDDKRPQLSDLRESGNIEQDADVVMFLYREEYYLSRSLGPEAHTENTDYQKKLSFVKNTADLIISKHRNGPTDTIQLFFDGATTRFENLAKDLEGNASYDR